MSNKTKQATFQILPMLLTSKEVAMMLGMNVLALSKWEKNVKNFPKRVYLAKRIYRFRRKDIEKFIEEL